MPSIQGAEQRNAINLIDMDDESKNSGTNPVQIVENGDEHSISLILFHGSWNKLNPATCRSSLGSKIHYAMKKFSEHKKDTETSMPDIADYIDNVQDIRVVNMLVDDDDENMDMCVDKYRAPADLPALRFVYKLEKSSTSYSYSQIININLSAREVLACLSAPGNQNTRSTSNDKTIKLSRSLARDLRSLLNQVKDEIDPKQLLPTNKKRKRSTTREKSGTQPLRLFIAGDKANVGKSSVCLGLLGTLLKRKEYPPSSLAYIKPATQCEKTQLVALFCKKHGIDCVPVGPLIYYQGFTREFLKGGTAGSDEMLLQIRQTVNHLASLGDKKVIIIDGVGYPAVGSITGTDNADVAKACSYNTSSSSEEPIPPGVLIVGKRGVGDAVDSYNLNSSYFLSKGVPVIGGVFNRFSEDGYYSRQKCKEAISLYFNSQSIGERSDEKLFGCIPEVAGIVPQEETMEKIRENEKLIADGYENAVASIEGDSQTNGVKEHSSSAIGQNTAMQIDEDESSIGKKIIGNEDGGKTVEEKQKLLLDSVMKGADQFITVFSAHVDVSGILESLKGKAPPVPRENGSQEQHEGPTNKQAKSNHDEAEMDNGHTSSKEQGEAKVDSKPTTNQEPTTVPDRDTSESTSTSRKRTREEIEEDAKMSGAKGG